MAVILSLGGSLIVPNMVDTNFLKQFSKVILNFIKKDKIIIYCGGGRLARDYQQHAKNLSASNNRDQDWVGIYATRLNACLVRTIFKDKAEEIILENPTEKISFKKRILICAGWKPGWSTDYDAVILAKQLGIKKIINMSNIEFVYTKDPKFSPDAKPLTSISWGSFRKLVGSKWAPGLSMPFDPIASKEAEKSKIEVNVIGKGLNNLKKCLEGKNFKGTIIK